MYIEACNLNDAFVKVCQKLLSDGVNVTRRGFVCREFPGAMLIKISNPTNRYITIPERKWNRYLGWIESLWIAGGDNSLAMPAHYVNNLWTFSDNGVTMRAGYGPRIRKFGHYSYDSVGGKPSLAQYVADDPCHINGVDQLAFVVEKLKEDINTREAAITIHDPVADDFLDAKTKEILKTKDTPCTRSIHFMVVDGKMNCYVDIRSNDVIWGFSAVNVFNFTLMQEYVAAMVGVPVGAYYHKVDNMHIYQDFIPMAEEIVAKHGGAEVEDIRFEYFSSGTPQLTLEEFDANIFRLGELENLCRGRADVPIDDAAAIEIVDEFTIPFFNDWARVIYNYRYRKDKDKQLPYINPILNRIM